MLKKLTLLAAMALAAIALAVPASASALEWTHNGEAFEGTVEDTLSGTIAFGNPAPGQTKFGCLSHIGVEVEGGTDTGVISSFQRTTETCAGEGAFAGCSLVEDEVTGLPADIKIVGTNEATLENGSLVFHNRYNAGCLIQSSTLTVTDLTMSGTNSDLTDVTINFVALAHFTNNLGVETTANVALFGTVQTETDTIGIS